MKIRIICYIYTVTLSNKSENDFHYCMTFHEFIFFLYWEGAIWGNFVEKMSSVVTKVFTKKKRLYFLCTRYNFFSFFFSLKRVRSWSCLTCVIVAFYKSVSSAGVLRLVCWQIEVTCVRAVRIHEKRRGLDVFMVKHCI